MKCQQVMWIFCCWLILLYFVCIVYSVWCLCFGYFDWNQLHLLYSTPSILLYKPIFGDHKKTRYSLSGMFFALTETKRQDTKKYRQQSNLADREYNTINIVATKKYCISKNSKITNNIVLLPDVKNWKWSRKYKKVKRATTKKACAKKHLQIDYKTSRVNTFRVLENKEYIKVTN